MTEEEHALILKIHDAFFEVPPGSPKDTNPLIEDLRTMVRAYHRASWVSRLLIWAVPTLAGFGYGLEKLKGYFVANSG